MRGIVEYSILIFTMFYIPITLLKLKLMLKYYLNNLLWTDCIPPPPLQIHMFMPLTPNMTIFEIRVFTQIIKVERIHKSWHPYNQESPEISLHPPSLLFPSVPPPPLPVPY